MKLHQCSLCGKPVRSLHDGQCYKCYTYVKKPVVVQAKTYRERLEESRKHWDYLRLYKPE